MSETNYKLPPDDVGNLCHLYLACFIIAVFPKYQLARHLQVLCTVLDQVVRGEETRIMVNMPPRHGKSETASIHFPAYFLGMYPHLRVIIACHTDRLAKRFGKRIKEIMESETFKKIFPNCRLSADTKAKGEFDTTAGGGFLATSIAGAATGYGADLLIIDDPTKNMQDARSEAVQQNVRDFYLAVALTRLEPGGRIVIIHTRWTETDLSGWLLDPKEHDEIDDWGVLKMPSVAVDDSDGWRKEGEALWPERFTIEDLEKRKKRLGSYVFHALYQQEPTSIEGRYILREWFQYYMWPPGLAASRDLKRFLHTDAYRIIQSWDTALEIDEENDYSVCGTWLDTASGVYLLDVQRDKWTGPQLLRVAKEVATIWQPDIILIEKKASGHGLIQAMREQTMVDEQMFNVVAYEPTMAKDLRLQLSMAPAYEGKRVYHPIPANAPFVSAYEHELCGFPTAAHDDQADMGSNFFDWKRMEENRMRVFNQGTIMDPADLFGVINQ